MAQEDDVTVIWEPQPRQAAFITCPADDVGFGGARGGGKSDGVIGDWIDHEETYGEHAIGIAFRRERTQLIELIERSKQVLRPLGYSWHEQDKYFRGPKGGRLRFTYLESDGDADAYQGHSYTRLYPEELGTFPSETPINKMQATLRSGNGVPCRMKGTCNPGGPGHNWVKSRYHLDTHPKGMEIFRFEFENPFTKRKIEKTRVFIPSRVSDNKYLGDDYVANLYQVGNTQLVKAWLEGDWSVTDGAFFAEWNNSQHVIEPFAIPDHWLKFRSGDWGSYSPFSFGWWAVASDDYHLPNGKIIPRGALVRYREWYGSVGGKLTAEQVGDGLVERERIPDEKRIRYEQLSYAVLDPAAFSEDGGPSIAERINDVLSKVHLAQFHRADNKRVSRSSGDPTRSGPMGGWDQMRARFVGSAERLDDGSINWSTGRPMIYFFETCRDTIRTIPVLQHDPVRLEDLDTHAEDHAADDVRYACMSRPWIKKLAIVEPIRGANEMTFDEALRLARPKSSADRRI